MKYDINHMKYKNFLAEQELNNKKAVNRMRSLTEGEEVVAVNEAFDIAEYLNKVLENIQKVWNKIKESVQKFFSGKSNNVIVISDVINKTDAAAAENKDVYIILKENEKSPNFKNIYQLINTPLADFPTDRDKMNRYGTPSSFIGDNYKGFFGTIGDKYLSKFKGNDEGPEKSSSQFAEEKCFTIAKGGEKIGFNSAPDGMASVKECLDYLQNYSSTIATLQKDIDKINAVTKQITDKINSARASENVSAKVVQNVNSSFSYNSSYGSLLFEAPDNPAVVKSSDSPLKPEKSAAPNANKSSGGDEESGNKVKYSYSDALEDMCKVYMKASAEILSIKFSKVYKAMFYSIKYCKKYRNEVAGNKSGNEKEKEQIDTNKIKKVK